MQLLQIIQNTKQVNIPDGDYFFSESKPGFEPHLFFKLKVKGSELVVIKISKTAYKYKYSRKTIETRFIPNKLAYLFTSAKRIKEDEFNNIIDKL